MPTDAVSLVLALSLGGAGLTFFLRGGYVFLLKPSLLFRREKKTKGKAKKQGELSPFSALCVALGGTIGVGNTVGVAAAICVGGAGAVFWMWVSGLLGTALKYAEVYLSFLHRDKKTRGGAMVLLKKLRREKLSACFCVFCLLVSLGMGNLAQGSAAAAALEGAFCLSPYITGIALLLLCLVLDRGGLCRLGAFCRVTVPFASLSFFLLCAVTLFINRAHVPNAVASIFREAFSLPSASAGLFAGTFLRSLSAGFARGIFSNEAGLGSAPLVHSEAQNTPSEQALWGVREVVLDTHVVCTLTALSILSSPVYLEGGFSDSHLCSAVFSAASGKWGETLFASGLVLFSAASILAWKHYGLRAAEFLFKKDSFVTAYKTVFFAAVFCGAIFDFSAVLLFSDFANAAMSSLNLYTLMRFRNDCRFPSLKKRNVYNLFTNPKNPMVK